MTTNKLNAFYPQDISKITQTNFSQPNTYSSKISQLVKPIFNKINDLSSKHLGSPTYLLVNQEDMVVQKIAKISAWIFGISPIILLGAYTYDHIVDLYHRRFENYSRMEEPCDKISEDPESPVLLPQDQPVIIEQLTEHTFSKTLEPSISNADDDFSDTTAQPDVDSELGEGEPESIQAMPTIEVNDSIKIPTPVESLTSDDISNTTPDSLEDSFEHVGSMTPELLEEMKNSPEMPSTRGGMVNRIIQIAKGVKAFWSNNPFTSNKPNVTNTIPSEPEYKGPSYEDLKMLDPIIQTYENPEIRTTAENIAQIKLDLPRMEIFVNGIHCSNIQEYINHLGLTLNADETDILQMNNPLVPKILDLVQQRSLNFSHNALANHWQHLNIIPMMAHIEGTLPIVRVNYTPEFPERCEITGETFFNILSMNEDGTGSSFLPYICKVKTKRSLDTVEVSWELIDKSSEEPYSETTTNPQAAEETEHQKPTSAESDDEDFEVLEKNPKDISNLNYNWDIAFNHLLNKPDECLSSTVTLEYLKSLRTNNDETFFYEDRLMFPVAITTDEIVKSLNNLKNNNPTNQKIFLPFLVKGWTVDHAVVAVINLADETIEYFDPKGQSSVWPTRAEKQSNKNVFDFLTELGQKVIAPTFSKDKIIYNKKNTPQGFYDNINCGAFCLQFIEERINRSFNDIENDLAADPKKLRLELANRLVKNAPSSSI